MANSERDNRVPFRNSEGYADPTAHSALTNIMREQREHDEKQEAADARRNQLIKVLKNTIDLAGFDLIARIEVRDRETGRIYR